MFEEDEFDDFSKPQSLDAIAAYLQKAVRSRPICIIGIALQADLTSSSDILARCPAALRTEGSTILIVGSRQVRGSRHPLAPEHHIQR